MIQLIIYVERYFFFMRKVYVLKNVYEIRIYGKTYDRQYINISIVNMWTSSTERLES